MRVNGNFPCAIIATPIASLLLVGCALLGSPKSVALFQFGYADNSNSAASPAAQQQRIAIIYADSSFNRESSGDRILTSTGNKAAYVAQARWAAPAQELFDTMVVRHIEARAPNVSVVRVGAPTKAQFMLAIDVRQFEARYSSDSQSPPDIVIDARAKLMHIADRSIAGDWSIVRHHRASENRIGAIVAAFDRTARDVSAQIASNVATAAEPS